MINLDKLKFSPRLKERAAFYASDFGKSKIDLFFDFTGEPQTNPPQWYETLKWGAGKGVEESMLEILKSNSIVAEDYDQKEHGRVSFNYKDIEIHGYKDAVHKTLGYPIEIKSVNNKNAYDIYRYENGYPKENYVGQLAMYMFAEKQKYGELFVATVDGLHTFCIPCHDVGNGKYKCGNVTVDVLDKLEQWNILYRENIVPKLLPDVFEKVYKKKVEDIDWGSVSKTDISKARNNKKVIGDWEVLYSPWKNKIIELQGGTLGYTEQELAYIREKTAGYSKKG